MVSRDDEALQPPPPLRAFRQFLGERRAVPVVQRLRQYVMREGDSWKECLFTVARSLYLVPYRFLQEFAELTRDTPTAERERRYQDFVVVRVLQFCDSS